MSCSSSVSTVAARARGPQIPVAFQRSNVQLPSGHLSSAQLPNVAPPSESQREDSPRVDPPWAGPHHLPPLGGGAALHRAAAAGAARQVQRLIQAWPELRNVPDRAGRTALSLAAETGGVEVIRLLLQAGASTSVRDAAGRCALFYAAQEENDEVLLFLLEQEARDAALDEWEQRQLQALTAPQTVPASQVIPHEGESSDIVTPDSSPASDVEQVADRLADARMGFQFAFETSWVEARMVELLEQLVRAGSLGGVATVWVLLCESAPEQEVLPRSTGGSTPLHWATLEGNEAMVGLLLQMGLDPNVGDHHGETPLHWACECRRDALITLLLRAGAHPDQPNASGQTPRQVAAGSHCLHLLGAFPLQASSVPPPPVPPIPIPPTP